MKEYVIDGNNLIHKSRSLAALQRKHPQSAREKLAMRLEGYFAAKNVRVYLYFDGHENLPIRTSKIKIAYSGSHEADAGIRKHIERSSNPRNVVLVSSDDDIRRLAQACSAEVVNSEDFAKLLSAGENEDEEEKRIRDLDEDEFKKLFGADN